MPHQLFVGTDVGKAWVHVAAYPCEDLGEFANDEEGIAQVVRTCADRAALALNRRITTRPPPRAEARGYAGRRSRSRLRLWRGMAAPGLKPRRLAGSSQ